MPIRSRRLWTRLPLPTGLLAYCLPYRDCPMQRSSASIKICLRFANPIVSSRICFQSGWTSCRTWPVNSAQTNVRLGIKPILQEINLNQEPRRGRFHGSDLASTSQISMSNLIGDYVEANKAGTDLNSNPTLSGDLTSAKPVHSFANAAFCLRGAVLS